MSDIRVQHSYNSVDVAEISYAQFNEDDVMKYSPCLFYKGDFKQLALAKKDGAITTIITANTANYGQNIEEPIKVMIDKELQSGDRFIFNYVTGDILLKNGDRQIKFFELYPNWVLGRMNEKEPSPMCGFVYTHETGEDKLAYFYATYPERIKILFSMSSVMRRKFLMTSGEQCSYFGLGLANYILQKQYMADFPILLPSEKVAKDYIPQSFATIENKEIYQELFELGEKARKDQEILDQKALDRTNIISAEFKESFDNTAVEDGYSKESQLQMTSIIPLVPEKEAEGSHVFYHKGFLLSTVLSKSIVLSPNSYPVELQLDLVTSPRIKKIIWTAPKELQLIIQDLDKLDSETIGIFEDFEVEFKEADL